MRQLHEEHAVPLALDGVLDLHQFRPAEVADLLREYLRSCRAAGVLQLRIIHGKGKGVLRQRVHSILNNEPAVRAFGLAQDRSSWGATWVDLYPADVTPPAKAPPKTSVSAGRPPFWYRLLQSIFLKK
ncbi:Smr/MutS family protein [Acidithiobacillus sp. IBUN Pt1247-S3]|uniref:Smr/MutS family protein n=1 Tax=Acidithiobacillus sp. IBUN Pt1247-S3 TaxID=3166642 RepID=UPI0034E5E92F